MVVINETNAVIAQAGRNLEPFAATSIAAAHDRSERFLVNGENAPLGRLLRGITSIRS